MCYEICETQEKVPIHRTLHRCKRRSSSLHLNFSRSIPLYRICMSFILYVNNPYKFSEVIFNMAIFQHCLKFLPFLTVLAMFFVLLLGLSVPMQIMNFFKIYTFDRWPIEFFPYKLFVDRGILIFIPPVRRETYLSIFINHFFVFNWSFPHNTIL